MYFVIASDIETDDGGNLLGQICTIEEVTAQTKAARDAYGHAEKFITYATFLNFDDAVELQEILRTSR